MRAIARVFYSHFQGDTPITTQRRRAPRKLPKQLRSQRTVDAILTATARVLVKDGYDRASTNRIAQVAGVSVGSLYQFFPNKHALFAALRKRHFDELDEVTSQMEQGSPSLPVRSAIQFAVELMIRAHAVDPELHRALEEEVPGMDVDRNRGIERRLHALVFEYLQERRDELLPTDLELAAFMVVPRGPRDPGDPIGVGEVIVTSAHQIVGALLAVAAVGLFAWQRRMLAADRS